jgi:hypothetical protein
MPHAPMGAKKGGRGNGTRYVFFQPAVSSSAFRWERLLTVEILHLHALKPYLNGVSLKIASFPLSMIPEYVELYINTCTNKQKKIGGNCVIITIFNYNEIYSFIL